MGTYLAEQGAHCGVVLCDDLNGWDGSGVGGRLSGREHIIHIFDSLRCTTEGIDVTL